MVPDLNACIGLTLFACFDVVSVAVNARAIGFCECFCLKFFEGFYWGGGCVVLVSLLHCSLLNLQCGFYCCEIFMLSEAILHDLTLLLPFFVFLSSFTFSQTGHVSCFCLLSCRPHILALELFVLLRAMMSFALFAQHGGEVYIVHWGPLLRGLSWCFIISQKFMFWRLSNMEVQEQHTIGFHYNSNSPGIRALVILLLLHYVIYSAEKIHDVFWTGLKILKL